MAKKLFKASVAEVELHRRRLQGALTAVDKASGEALSSRVVADLKVAHRDVCLAITFLTVDGTETGPQGAAAARCGLEDPNFLKKGGRADPALLFDKRSRDLTPA